MDTRILVFYNTHCFNSKVSKLAEMSPPRMRNFGFLCSVWSIYSDVTGFKNGEDNDNLNDIGENEESTLVKDDVTENNTNYEETLYENRSIPRFGQVYVLDNIKEENMEDLDGFMKMFNTFFKLRRYCFSILKCHKQFFLNGCLPKHPLLEAGLCRVCQSDKARGRTNRN